jgi:IS5 family transposase
MKQLRLAESGFVPKKEKRTQKEEFLGEMERVVPWSRFEALLDPHYPKKGNGRQPMSLQAMVRIHFMPQWFGQNLDG